MSSADFTKKKFTFRQLCDRYIADIKALATQASTPLEKQKLNTYMRAVATVRNTKVMDLAKFALSFGHASTGQAGRLRRALPVIIADNIINPKPVDILYLKLLSIYAQAFRDNRKNLKDWFLRVVLSSKLSPVTPYVDSEINRILANNQNKIAHFQSSFNL